METTNTKPEEYSSDEMTIAYMNGYEDGKKQINESLKAENECYKSALKKCHQYIFFNGTGTEGPRLIKEIDELLKED